MRFRTKLAAAAAAVGVLGGGFPALAALRATAGEGSAIAFDQLMDAARRSGGMVVESRSGAEGVEERTSSDRSVDDLIAAVDDWSDPAVAVDVVRELVQQEHGLDLPDFHPDTSVDDESPVVTYQWAYPTGDIDGDGHSDVMTGTRGSAGLIFQPFSGLTGQPLWSQSVAVEDAILGVMRDADGDGWSEIFSLFYRGLDCTGCDSGEVRFEWTLSMLSGADGSPLWTKTMAGWSKHTYEPRRSSFPGLGTTTETTTTYDAENLLVFPSWSTALTGHNPNRIVSVTITSGSDFSYSRRHDSLLENQRSFEGRGRWHSRGELVDARTGEPYEILERVGTGAASLIGVGDVVGGPEVDWLWSSNERVDSSYDCTTHLPLTGLYAEECSDPHDDVSLHWHGQARDGGTFAAVWDAVLPVGPSVFVKRFGDLDGDSREDFVLSESLSTGVHRLVSGGTGSLLWESPGRWLQPAGDLDGDGDADVLMGHLSSSGPSATVRAERRDGATGTVLFSTTHTQQFSSDNNGYHISYGVSVLADTGGSTAPDLRFVFIDHRAGSSGRDLIEDGATAAIHLERQHDLTPGLYGHGDVDGDGRAELFEAVSDDTSRVLRVSDQTSLWEFPRSRWPYLVSDRDGVPGREVMFASFPSEGATRFELRRGATGDLIWALESPTGSPYWHRV